MARAAVLGARGQLRDDAGPLPPGLRRVARRPAPAPRATDIAAALRAGRGPALRIARRPPRGHHPHRRPGGGRGGRARGARTSPRHRRVHAPAARGRRSRAGPDARADGGPQGGRGGGRRRQGLRPDARGRGPLHRGRPDPRRRRLRDRARPLSRRLWSRSRPSGTSSICTEVLVRGEQLPPANEVRAAMHAFGGSVVVAVDGRYPQDPCAHRHPGGRL